jgi:hypothetical protein
MKVRVGLLALSSPRPPASLPAPLARRDHHVERRKKLVPFVRLRCLRCSVVKLRFLRNLLIQLPASRMHLQVRILLQRTDRNQRLAALEGQTLLGASIGA